MKKYLPLPILFLAAGFLLMQSVFLAHSTTGAAPERDRKDRVTAPLARMGEEISVRAAGRGAPRMKLSDGRSLLTSYVGDESAARALENDRARGLSLASDDFDGDGTADLVCGYASPTGGGIVALHRGNVDAIHPNRPEARCRKARGEFTDAPFLAPARVFALPEAAEFLGAGDFDADGRRDVVAASATGKALYLLKGDGQLGLAKPERVELPGRVTAMAVGEINRADGLEDVVVGVDGLGGPRALVFEGPRGALRSEPEAIKLPAGATSLAIGQLDSRYEYDLAIAAGSELVIVKGRDRKLLWKEFRGVVKVEPAMVSRQQFSFSIASLAIGEFVREGGYGRDIAVLSEDGRVQYLRRGDGETRGRADADMWQTMAEVKVAEFVPASRSLAGIGSSERIEIASLLPLPGDFESVYGRRGGSPTVREGVFRVNPSRVSAGGPVLTKVKVSSLETNELVLIDRASNRMHVVGGGPGSKRPLHEMSSLDIEGEAMAALSMRLNKDGLSDLVMLTGPRAAPAMAVQAGELTIRVTNANDSGAGSFREAIERANTNPGRDTILFEGAGLRLQPTFPLPVITDPVIIDGRLPDGTGAILDGKRASITGVIVDGLTIFARNSEVRGLLIDNFSGSGISVGGQGGNVIDNNIFGTSFEAGNQRFGGNQRHGIEIVNSSDNTISANIMGRNAGNGVLISGSGARNNKVLGNSIGIDGGNGRAGVMLTDGASGNFIEENTIKFNHRAGVEFTNGASGNLVKKNEISDNEVGVRGITGIKNRITENSIFSNDGSFISNNGLGIDLDPIGIVNPNDDGDGDTGPNLKQNFPELISARKNADGSIQVKGFLESTPNTTFAIEFFSNPECDQPYNHGEGKTFIGSTLVVTDSSGRAEFDVPLQGVGAGAFITSTATDPLGNTGEFSGCVAPEATCTVTTTSPVGPGSILNCLQFANSNTGFDVIGFDIPTSAPGYDSSTGIWTIRFFIPPPPITTEVAIDATTQPGYQGIPVVVWAGSGITTPPTAAGLTVFADNVTVRGVAVTGFGFGLRLTGNGAVIIDSSYDGNRFDGVLAVNSNGHYFARITALNNGGNGFRFSNSDSNMFRDNRSSGNGAYGASFENGANANFLFQNRFGTDPTGTSGIGNGLGELRLIDSSGNIIGAPGFGNTFAFAPALSTTANVTVLLSGAGTQNNRINGNFFGTDPTRTLNLGNPNTVGLSIESGAGNTSISGNVFANLRNGIITRSAGTGNSWEDNQIYSVTDVPIDINFNGPDTSGFPFLRSATQANSTHFQGTLTGRPDAIYTLDFFANPACQPSGFGEGQFPLGSRFVMTDGSGNAQIDVGLIVTVPAGHFITATATDPDGNSTELSLCTPVTGTRQADLTLSNTGPAAVSAGQRIEYLIEAKNDGEASALETVVTDDLPACLTQIVCDTSQGECLVVGNRVMARLGVINETDKATVTITATVNESCGTLLTNTAHVSAAGDTNAANDTATANTPIGPPNQPPLAKAHDVTVAAGADCTADASVDDGSSDPDGDPITLTQTPASPYPLGSTQVTLTVTDSIGSSSQATATVTVIDTTPPTLIAPPNIDRGNDPGACSANLDPGTPTVNDNCPGVVSAGVRSDGQTLSAPYPVGTTIITWTATDTAGSAASSSQEIVVRDVEAPVITGAAVDKPVLWPANHKMVDVQISYGVSDNCDPASMITPTLSVTSKEPLNGTGDGNTSPDWEVIDANRVRLRAERSGNGTGRIYTIAITATDSKGNSTTRTVSVTVPHDHARLNDLSWEFLKIPISDPGGILRHSLWVV